MMYPFSLQFKLSGGDGYGKGIQESFKEQITFLMQALPSQMRITL